MCLQVLEARRSKLLSGIRQTVACVMHQVARVAEFALASIAQLHYLSHTPIELMLWTSTHLPCLEALLVDLMMLSSVQRRLVAFQIAELRDHRTLYLEAQGQC